MTDVIGRMIARARAPLSAVEPLLPSRYQPDRRSAHANGPGMTGDLTTVPRAEEFEETAGGFTPEPPAARRVPDPNATPAAPFGTARATQAPIAPDAGALEERMTARHESARGPARGERDDRVRPVHPDGRRSEQGRTPVQAPVPSRIDPASPFARRVSPSNRASAPAAAEVHLATVEDAVDGSGAPTRRTTRQAVFGESPLESRWADAVSLAAPARDGAAADGSARRGGTEVTITIGQIEVRSAPPAEPRKPAARPRVTLDEYLRRRDAAGR